MLCILYKGFSVCLYTGSDALPYIKDVTFQQYKHKYEIMLNDIIPPEWSISKMITQSPSLVSMHDTLVSITTLEKVFLNITGSQYLMANNAITWSTTKILGNSLLTHQRFNHLIFLLGIYT